MILDNNQLLEQSKWREALEGWQRAQQQHQQWREGLLYLQQAPWWGPVLAALGACGPTLLLQMYEDAQRYRVWRALLSNGEKLPYLNSNDTPSYERIDAAVDFVRATTSEL